MKLIVQRGSEVREFFLEEGEYRVGRDPSCEISINDPYLSRIDFKIEVKGKEVRIKEENSRNGVFVKGKRVKEHILSAGDIVEAGDSRFSFLFENVEETLVKGLREETVLKEIKSISPSSEDQDKKIPSFPAPEILLLDISSFVKYWKISFFLGIFACLLSFFNPFSREERSVRKDRTAHQLNKEVEGVSSPRKENVFSESVTFPRESTETFSVPQTEEVKVQVEEKEEKKVEVKKREKIAQASNPEKKSSEEFSSDPRTEFARFSYKSLMERGLQFFERGEFDFSFEAYGKACSIARQFLQEKELKDCERMRERSALFLSRNLFEKGLLTKAYSTIFPFDFPEARELKLEIEGKLDEKVKEIYSRSALDVNSSKEEIEKILRDVPEGSPVAERAKKVLRSLQ